MLKKIYLIIICLLVSLSGTSLFAFGVKEDKVYSVDTVSSFDTDYHRPEFLNDENYTYKSNVLEGNSIHHVFAKKSGSNKYGSGKNIIKNLDLILGKELTYMEIIELFKLPTKVLVAEEGHDYHLNLYYDEVQLYFGIRDELNEVRFHNKTDYKYEGKISYGSTLNDVLEILPVSDIVEGEEVNFYKHNVLYKDINGTSGYHYVEYKDKNVRLFFFNDKVHALYIY